MAGLKRLVAWWQTLPLPWRSWRIVGRVLAGDEVPDQLPNRGAVLVGPLEHASWLAFDCPCQGRHRLMVNLDRSRNPFWKIDCLKPLSIHPSIYNITPGRSCHFFIRSGRIRWVKNDIMRGTE